MVHIYIPFLRIKKHTVSWNKEIVRMYHFFIQRNGTYMYEEMVRKSLKTYIRTILCTKKWYVVQRNGKYICTVYLYHFYMMYHYFTQRKGTYVLFLHMMKCYKEMVCTYHFFVQRNSKKRCFSYHFFAVVYCLFP